VQVRWPSGLVESFNNLLADKLHTLREGSGEKVTSTPTKVSGKGKD